MLVPPTQPITLHRQPRTRAHTTSVLPTRAKRDSPTLQIQPISSSTNTLWFTRSTCRRIPHRCPLRHRRCRSHPRLRSAPAVFASTIASHRTGTRQCPTFPTEFVKTEVPIPNTAHVHPVTTVPTVAQGVATRPRHRRNSRRRRHCHRPRR